MQINQNYIAHARTLRSEILDAPGVWLPRREILLEWLEGFLERAARSTYELAPSEATDLEALEKFLRKRHVPASN